MPILRRSPLYKTSFVVSLFIAVASMVPAARTQVESRIQPAQASAKPVTTGAGKPSPRTESTVPSPNFTPPIFLAPVMNASSQPNAIAVGDVNGDGKPDIVTGNCPDGDCGAEEPGTISVFLGNGDGTFQAPTTYPSGGQLPISVVIADMNGDGKPDILVANEDYGDVVMLLGNGDGTFQPPQSVVGFAAPQELLVADINHDGKPDLVVFGGSISVLVGNGDGTFQPAVNYEECCIPSSSLAMADVNGDGNLDLLVAYWDLGVGVRLGRGDGSFQSETRFATAGILPGSIAAADVNGDGHIDLVLPNVCLGGCGGSGTVLVMLGNGDGTFQTPANYGWAGFGSRSVAIADINKDGKPDLVVGGASCAETCEQGPNGIGVLLGNGDGTFQATVPYSPANATGDSVLVQDVNGDKRPDVISIATGISPWLQVWLHVGSTHTTTALTSSVNPSVFGQAVSLTANVNVSSGTPTGSVELFDNSSGCLDFDIDCGGAALVNRSAVFSNIPLFAGSHPLLATYQGSLAFQSSTSKALNQVVKMATTTTSVISSLNPATPARKFTYIANVVGQFGGGAYGTVTFSDGGTTLATLSLETPGPVTYTVANQSCGVHPITTSYSGDANNFASTSLTLNENVQCATSTALTTSGSPTFAGQPVTFTAKVTSKFGKIPDGEMVTFSDGKTALASVPLSGGAAIYTTSSLSAISHTIGASYAGDAAFTPSTFRITQKVVKYTTSTALSSSANPSQQGQSVTFTAKVQSSGGPAPTGKVIFKNGAASIGTAVLSGGVATLTKSNLPAGTNSLTADYSGDTVSAASKSALLSQVVH